MTTIPKLIFIVPYRDREKQKQHFSIYMKYIMEDIPTDDYEIYYSHQTDNRKFNRGATKNIGFLSMKEKYPNDYKNITFVFNDIDILPAVKNTFNYITVPGVVKHFYGFEFALGGIFSINGGDFEKCNGFPNNWGWGLEDNALNDRAIQNSLIINRSQFYPINSTNIIHLYDNPDRIISSREPLSYINKQLNDNLDSINYLTYSIINHTNAEETGNNKVTSIKQNEFIINIHTFKTLINESSSIYYTQNLALTSTIDPHKYNRVIRRNVKPRWLLNNNFK
jgi:hypothetical protein